MKIKKFKGKEVNGWPYNKEKFFIECFDYEYGQGLLTVDEALRLSEALRLFVKEAGK